MAVAIREGAPNHTIIATGARYSDDDDLLSIEPLHDSNVIYTFHFTIRMCLPTVARLGEKIIGIL